MIVRVAESKIVFVGKFSDIYIGLSQVSHIHTCIFFWVVAYIFFKIILLVCTNLYLCVIYGKHVRTRIFLMKVMYKV